MGRGIQIAARFEPYYLKAGNDNRKKARVLDRMRSFLGETDAPNTGVLLKILTGEL
jgi:hypothetical protein